MVASSWFNLWCDSHPLDKYILKRDVARAGSYLTWNVADNVDQIGLMAEKFDA